MQGRNNYLPPYKCPHFLCLLSINAALLCRVIIELLMQVQQGRLSILFPVHTSRNCGERYPIIQCLSVCQLNFWGHNSSMSSAAGQEGHKLFFQLKYESLIIKCTLLHKDILSEAQKPWSLPSSLGEVQGKQVIIL